MSLLKYLGRTRPDQENKIYPQENKKPLLSLHFHLTRRKKRIDLESSSHVNLKDLPKDKPNRDTLGEYPKTASGKTEYSFYFKWIENREWLEYIKDVNACLCFPCIVFTNKEGQFFTIGFRNWKSALQAGAEPKGFAKHALSKSHIKAMKLRNEHKN